MGKVYNTNTPAERKRSRMCLFLIPRFPSQYLNLFLPFRRATLPQPTFFCTADERTVHSVVLRKRELFPRYSPSKQTPSCSFIHSSTLFFSTPTNPPRSSICPFLPCSDASIPSHPCRVPALPSSHLFSRLDKLLGRAQRREKGGIMAHNFRLQCTVHSRRNIAHIKLSWRKS